MEFDRAGCFNDLSKHMVFDQEKIGINEQVGIFTWSQGVLTFHGNSGLTISTKDINRAVLAA